MTASVRDALAARLAGPLVKIGAKKRGISLGIVEIIH